MVDSLDDQSGTTCHWENQEGNSIGENTLAAQLHIHDDVGQRRYNGEEYRRRGGRVKIFFTPLEHSRVEWMMMYCIAALKIFLRARKMHKRSEKEKCR